MNFRTFLAIFIGFLSASLPVSLPAFAELNCVRSVLAKVTAREKRAQVIIKDRMFPISEYESAIQVIRDVDTKVLTGLEPVPMVELHLRKDGLTSNIIDDTHSSIYLVRPEIIGKANARAIAAHEYGHLLFRWNFGRFSPETKAWKDGLLQAQRYHNENLISVMSQIEENHLKYQMIKERSSRIERRISADALEEYQDKVLEKGKQLWDEEDRIMQGFGEKGAKRPPVFASDSLPYEELFCDLLSVIVERNPKAISNALPEAFGRDFTQTISWQGWSKVDPHHTFDPVRSFLWSHYLSKMPDMAQQSKLLEQVYEVLAKDLLEQSAISVYERPLIEKSNERLIRNLTKVLSP